MTISLAALEAAGKAATPGEWGANGTDEPDEYAYGVIDSDGFYLADVENARDAELIALYCNETPTLVAALRAVLALHQPADIVLCSRGALPGCTCGWPDPQCPTVQAITDAGVTE